MEIHSLRGRLPAHLVARAGQGERELFDFVRAISYFSRPMKAFADFKQPGDVTAGSIFEALDDMTDIDARLAIFNCRPTAHTRAMLYFSADRLLPIFLQPIVPGSK